MPRHARSLSITRIYHVVIKGADRVRLFEEPADYLKYLDILAYFKQECKYEIFAYCLMSNHVHLLIRHPEDMPLHTIFRRINTTYAIWFNSKYSRTGFLQNDRFHSEPIVDDRYLLTVVRYIHRNPVKGGLESAVGSDYRWSSYHEYCKMSSKLLDFQFVLSKFESLDQFKDFHSLPDTDSDYTCIDIDKIRRRIPDDVAHDIIREISHCDTSKEFQSLSLIERDLFIVQMHKKGVSIRQLNRLTGTPRGVINRILEKS